MHSEEKRLSNFAMFVLIVSSVLRSVNASVSLEAPAYRGTSDRTSHGLLEFIDVSAIYEYVKSYVTEARSG